MRIESRECCQIAAQRHPADGLLSLWIARTSKGIVIHGEKPDSDPQCFVFGLADYSTCGLNEDWLKPFIRRTRKRDDHCIGQSESACRIGGREATAEKLRAALKAAGVEFTNGDQPGVRMKVKR